MVSNQWLARRKPYWHRLEELVEQTNRNGYKSLTRKELQELALLYRQTASDLSVVREDTSSQHFARYLNQLLGRAHNIIYSGRRSSPKGIWEFFVYDYPKIFRRNFAYTALAFGIFLGSGILGMLLTAARPQFMRSMLGPAMVDTIERHEMWTHSIVGMMPEESSKIMTNNMHVSFWTFALGITAGVGTLYLEFFNGLLIGVVGTACWQSGMSLQLWSFVVGHGSLELPAIFIAGGSGFLIARGLLFPGTLSRVDSLAKYGGEAVRLMVGTIPMLFIAGIVEGFISPREIPVASKFGLGIALFTLLVLWVMSDVKRPVKKNLLNTSLA